MGSIPAQLAEGDFGKGFGCRHLGPFNLSLKPLCGPGYRLTRLSLSRVTRLASADEVGQELGFYVFSIFGITYPMPTAVC